MIKYPMKCSVIAVVFASVVAACGGPVQVAESIDAVVVLRAAGCRVPIVASAVFVDDELAVSAAHNVAGASGVITVTDASGDVFAADVVRFDPQRDIAVLFVPGVTGRSIRRSHTPTGDGSIIRLSPELERIDVAITDARSITITGTDIYNEPSDTVRQGVQASADIAPGFSGSPMLDSSGAMAAMVVSESRASGFVYGVAWDEIDDVIDAGGDRIGAETIDVGRCR